VVKPAAKPVAKPAAKLVAKPVVKPVAKAVAKPVAKAVAKPGTKAAAKPAAKAAAKPATKPAAKIAAKPMPKAAPHPAGKPKALSQDPTKDEKVELLQRYGDDRMVMMARDPWWLFTYWDLSPARMAEGVAWASGRPHEGVLRVYDSHGAWQDSPVHLDQMGHYLKVWAPGQEYVAEVGLRDQEGRFLPLLRSNPASAPPDQPSTDLGEEWTDIFGAAALWAASWGQGPQAGSSLSLGLPGSALSPSSPFGGASEHLASAWLAGSAASSWSSPGAAWGASPSSPWGAAAAPGAGDASAEAGRRARKFFLWSKTELILYGGTEPDAALTVSGKPVALRPDGTFTLRFALPDGDLDLEVKATSADKQEALGMTHQVKKGTKR
jgi:hypothetical protein